jgi:hypothetical protein
MRGRGWLVVPIVLAAVTAGAAGARAHHNDWAAPLLGGAIGGYALSSIIHSSEASKQPHAAPTYSAAPPPQRAAAPADPTASAEARLRQLDALAAGGYITKQEYQTRRQAILDTL